MGVYQDYAPDAYFAGYEPVPIARGQKRPLVTGWTRGEMTLERVVQMAARRDPNMGFRTGRLVGFDVDITDPKLSAAVEQELQRIAPSRLKRVGRAPKFAYLYRRADEEPPQPKLTSDRYGEHRIEVLGTGQQIVVDGDHADTNKPYEWPMDHWSSRDLDDLPEISQVQVDEIIARFYDLAADAGYTRTATGQSSAATQLVGVSADDEEAQWLASYRPKAGLPLDSVPELLDHLRYDAMPYDDRLRVAGALWHEYDGDPQIQQLLEARPIAGDKPCDAERWDSLNHDGKRAVTCVRSIMEQYNVPADLIPSSQQDTGSSALELPDDQLYDLLPEDLYAPGRIKARKLLYGNYLTRSTITVVNGAGGSAKSVLALTMAVSLALGRDLTGLVEGTLRPRRSLIVNNEDDTTEIMARIFALCQYYGVPQEEYQHIVLPALAIIPRGQDPVTLATMDQYGQVVPAPGLERVRRAAVKHGAEVLFLDPFVSLHSANENDAGEMEAVMSLIRGLVIELEAGGFLIHHSKKGGTDDADDAARGSGAIVNAGRGNFLLKRMTRKEAEELDIPVQERTRYIRVNDGKANYNLPAGDADWLYLNSVGIEVLDEEEGQIAMQSMGVLSPLHEPLPDPVEVKEQRQAQRSEQKVKEAKAQAERAKEVCREQFLEDGHCRLDGPQLEALRFLGISKNRAEAARKALAEPEEDFLTIEKGKYRIGKGFPDVS